MVEDLIVAAIKDGQARGAAKNVEEMNRLSESLGLPTNMKLPF